MKRCGWLREVQIGITKIKLTLEGKVYLDRAQEDLEE